LAAISFASALEISLARCFSKVLELDFLYLPLFLFSFLVSQLETILAAEAAAEATTSEMFLIEDILDFEQTLIKRIE
jgi:hypothetical protein